MTPSPLQLAALAHVVQGLSRSAPPAINERSNALHASGRKILKFSLRQSPFPVPASAVAALRAAAHQKDYLPVRGLRPLQELISGSKKLMFITQLAYAELLVPNPSWVYFVPQAKLLGRPYSWLPTLPSDDWKLKASTLDAHCTKAPGSARTISAVMPVTQRCLDGQPLRDAVAAPRLHAVPAARVDLEDSAAAEASTAGGEQLALTLQNLAADIMIGERNAYFGGVHAVGYERGQWTGAADPRRDGAVAESRELRAAFSPEPRSLTQCGAAR